MMATHYRYGSWWICHVHGGSAVSAPRTTSGKPSLDTMTNLYLDLSDFGEYLADDQDGIVKDFVDHRVVVVVVVVVLAACQCPCAVVRFCDHRNHSR